MKLSLPVLFDTLFCLFVSFLISLLLLNYFIRQPFSIIIAAALSIAVGFLAYKFLSKSKGKDALKKQEREALENMCVQFNFSSSEKNNEFFLKLFKSLGYSVERKKGGIFFKDKPVVVLVKFGFTPVTKADVVKFYNDLKKEDVGYILAEEFSSDIKYFISRFNDRLVAVDSAKLYCFLKEKNALPQTQIKFTEKKQKGLALLKNLLYKNKAKNYLVFGLTFLLMSYFFPFKLYYVIVGVIFLLAALFSRLFGLCPDKK